MNCFATCHPLHKCYNEPKGDKKEGDKMGIFEVEVRGPVPNEPVVLLAGSVEDNTQKRVNAVVNGVSTRISCILRAG